MDELCSGTDPKEGANLAISLLEKFNEEKCLTIISTHYQEVKNYCLTHKDYENASVEFDINQMKPTYNLILGIPGRSYCFEISKNLGIPEEIINNAKEKMNEKDVKLEDIIKQIYDDKIKIEKENQELQKNLNQITNLRKRLEKEENQKLQEQYKKIEDSKIEARRILLDAKEEAKDIIKKLNNEQNLKEAESLRNELNSSIKNLQGKKSRSGIDYSNLLKLNNKEMPKNGEKGTYKTIHKETKNASTEINLLGETVDEAIANLEKFLDDAKMANIDEVRIVHGKGTGALKKGVQNYLKRSKYIKSFRDGHYGEGDGRSNNCQIKIKEGRR